MEWFEYPYPRPDLMNKWSFARHSEVMTEKFETEASKKNFDREVQSLFKSFRRGKARADLSSLFECLYAAAKMEEREDPACRERSSFTQLYSEGLQILVEDYVHDPPCWKTAPTENDIVLYCMALTGDLAKCVIKSLQITNMRKYIDPGRTNNAIAIIRSLTTAVDKDSLFHKLNKHRPLPSWILFHHHQYTKALATMPTTSSSLLHRSCEEQSDDHSSWMCGCSRCSIYAQEPYLWINILLEHFGRGSGIRGFDIILDILVKISLLETTRPDILQLCESVLQFLSKAAEFLKEEKRHEFVSPCLSLQGAISRWHRANQLADESLIGTVTLIAQHLRFIFDLLFAPGVAKAVMATTNKSLRDLLLSFQSSEANKTATIVSPSSSPRETMEGTERLHVAKIDATTGRAIKDEVSRQMRQQLTKFVSELLAMLLPTIQQSGSRAVMKIKQQSDSDVGGGGGGISERDTLHHRDIFYPHPPSLATTQTLKENLAELSPPRSSSALGATMRNAAEIVSQSKISSMYPPSSRCSPDPNDDT
ncbi:unnamed protein product [Calypogeia fissa]